MQSQNSPTSLLLLGYKQLAGVAGDLALHKNASQNKREKWLLSTREKLREKTQDKTARWAVKGSDTLISAHQIEYIYVHPDCALLLKLHSLLGAQISNFRSKPSQGYFFFFKLLPVTPSRHPRSFLHPLIQRLQGGTSDSSFNTVDHRDWWDFSKKTV